MLVAQSYLTLWDPMDCSPPGSSVHEIIQTRILEWVNIHFSRRSSWPRDWTQVTCIADSFFTVWAIREAHIEHERKWSHSVMSDCDHMDHSLPDSSIHGIFQARVLEWIAIAFSRRSSQSRDWTWVSCILGRCFTVWDTRKVPHRVWMCLKCIMLTKTVQKQNIYTSWFHLHQIQLRAKFNYADKN